MSKITETQLSITTSNHIVLDGVTTDYRVIQRKDETVVYKGHVPYGQEIVGIKLPHAQYSTALDGHTLAGNPGRVEFYRDLKAAIGL